MAIFFYDYDRNHQTTPDPNSKKITAVDLLHDPAFGFRYGDGSGLDGYNVLTVDAGGHCVYVFFSYQKDGAQTWKRAAFTCDSQILLDLRQLLQDIRVTELAKAYYNTRIADGHQRFLELTLSGYKKGIFWDNYFPASGEKLDAFVNDRILKPQANAIGRATPTSRPVFE